MHVLILDNRVSQGAHLKRGLRYENIDSDVLLYSTSWNEEVHKYSAVIVHVEMLGEYELDICLWFETCYPKLPIIIIDDQESVISRDTSLKKGAHAYLGRPFSFRDLALQIKFFVYKQRDMLQKKSLSYKDLKLFLETREAQRNGERVPLRNKEFALLEYFMLNKGQILTRNEILENVWDRNANILTNTVDVHVNSLRRKIDNNYGDKLIHTIPCVGYCFGVK